MRKLLILMLVIGLASLANAVPMELWVAHGSAPGVPPLQGEYYDPVDSELILLPSDYLWVGIYNPVQGVPGAAQKPTAQFLLLETAPDVAWTGNWTTYVPPLVPGTPPNYYYGSAIDIFGDGSLIADTWMVNLSDGNPATFNAAGVLDAKELHCEELSLDNLVLLFDGATGYIDDMIIIHQIPEPATIALLGLGSLFLMRRRRK